MNINKSYIFLLLFLSCSFFILHGQRDYHWKGKSAAIAFTYDDALNQHLDIVVPILDSFNFKGSFYVAPVFQLLNTRMEEWKKIASNGHELGNHTLFHPCNGGKGREWVSEEQDLRKYSYQRILNEVKVANDFLNAIDGKSERTFAFTCGDRFVDGKEFIRDLSSELKGARSVRNEMHTIDQIDIYNIDGFMINNQSFEEMRSWVDRAIEERSLLVFLFHGVGGGHGLNCSERVHSQIIKYIASKSKDILVEPLVEIVSHIEEWQKKK
jgi:sialate O-acetylesterase